MPKIVRAIDVVERLPSHTTMDATTFKGMKVKARFIDEKYGEWWALPENVVRGHYHYERREETRKETCQKKYGTNNVMQKRDTLIKNHQQQWKTRAFFHWKTGETLFCTGSYEIAVVLWLNRIKIDFQWQIPFKLDDGSTYFVDLYLPHRDTYVEIKGYWNKNGYGKRKWEEFHSKYPNSEVWMENELVELGIIRRRKR